MIVSKEMANRIDDSNSITACPRGELRSDSGREATVVMGIQKRSQQRNGGTGPARNVQGRKTGLGVFYISRFLIITERRALGLETP
jgi:hypothetical protein